MASLGTQFTLLLWKNFVLQGRKKCVTVFEILVPLFFAALLLLIRVLSKSEYIDHNTQYGRFSLNTVVHGQGDKILYTPSNPYTDALMSTVNSVYITTTCKSRITSRENLSSGVYIKVRLKSASATETGLSLEIVDLASIVLSRLI